MLTIPTKTPATFRKGDTGIGVWAIQKARGLTPDGSFGPATHDAVRKWQYANNLVVDGIAGYLTQRSIVGSLIAYRQAGVPAGLLSGFAEAEGGWMFAAVNWSVAGGVDCGPLQRRVYEADYTNEATVKRAFDAAYQAGLLRTSLVERYAAFLPRPGTRDGSMPAGEKAWRLAALSHNWPAGANRLSNTPVSELYRYWTTSQEWVTSIGARFPDGTLVDTPLAWAHRYCGVLGDRYGTTGVVTKAITSWAV